MLNELLMHKLYTAWHHVISFAR